MCNTKLGNMDCFMGKNAAMLYAFNMNSDSKKQFPAGIGEENDRYVVLQKKTERLGWYWNVMLRFM